METFSRYVKIKIVSYPYRRTKGTIDLGHPHIVIILIPCIVSKKLGMVAGSRNCQFIIL